MDSKGRIVSALGLRLIQKEGGGKRGWSGVKEIGGDRLGAEGGGGKRRLV